MSLSFLSYVCITIKSILFKDIVFHYYPSFYLCQHVLEFGIVDLHAVVEVDGDHLVG